LQPFATKQPNADVLETPGKLESIKRNIANGQVVRGAAAWLRSLDSKTRFQAEWQAAHRSRNA